MVQTNNKLIGHGLDAGRIPSAALPPTRPPSHFNSAWFPKVTTNQERITQLQINCREPGRRLNPDSGVIFYPATPGLCVFDQHPGYCLPVIGWHHVVVSDGCACGRKSDHLPHPALGAPLPGMGCGAEGFARHLSPSFRKLKPRREKIERQANLAYNSNCQEPRGSLFVGRRVSNATHSAVRGVPPPRTVSFYAWGGVLSTPPPHPLQLVRESVVL
jgi:hypothetical protein